MFTRPDGRHLDVHEFSRAFKRIRTELGLPAVRLHDLRHAHASVLLKQGQHLKIVSERLGHSTIAITGDTYSHLMAGVQRAAANAFSDALEGRSANTRNQPRRGERRSTSTPRCRLVPKVGFEPTRD